MPGATVIVPLAFNVNPVGTVTPVSVTCPGLVPITAAAPFKVSFAITDGVLAPAVMAVGVSFTASMLGSATVITALAVLQFVEFAFSQI